MTTEKTPREVAADLLTVAFQAVIDAERDEDADPQQSGTDPRAEADTYLQHLDHLVDWNGPPKACTASTSWTPSTPSSHPTIPTTS